MHWINRPGVLPKTLVAHGGDGASPTGVVSGSGAAHRRARIGYVRTEPLRAMHGRRIEIEGAEA
jgi:hypothetical protein